MSEIKKALCLDFNGTIRVSKHGGFIQKPEDIILINDIEDIIYRYKDAGIQYYYIDDFLSRDHKF